jgi:hypothetical protein
MNYSLPPPPEIVCAAYRWTHANFAHDHAVTLLEKALAWQRLEVAFAMLVDAWFEDDSSEGAYLFAPGNVDRWASIFGLV